MPALLGESLTAGLLPHGVYVAASIDRGAESALFPIEAEAVRRAIPRRRAEFAAGRVLAHGLLAQLGAPTAPIPVGPDRQPLWPDGYVGSIAHTRGLCVAAVAQASQFRGLGVDAEPHRAIGRDLWTTICTTSELEWVGAQPARDRGRLVRLLFSAKESVFKCVFPRTRTWLEFRDVEVMFHVEHSSFTIRTPRLPPPPLSGRFVIRDGWVLTAAWQPA